MSTEPGLAPQGQKLPLILAAVAVVAVVIPAGLLGGVFAAPATRRRPTLLAMARPRMARPIGNPQRTSVPASGSPVAGAANTPPSRPAGMTTATTATAARIKGSFCPCGARPGSVLICTP